jgi:hypothetical protein
MACSQGKHAAPLRQPGAGWQAKTNRAPANQTGPVPLATARNALLCPLRCLGERGFALISQRWRTFQRVTLSPAPWPALAIQVLVFVAKWCMDEK